MLRWGWMLLNLSVGDTTTDSADGPDEELEWFYPGIINYRCRIYRDNYKNKGSNSDEDWNTKDE